MAWEVACDINLKSFSHISLLVLFLTSVRMLFRECSCLMICLVISLTVSSSLPTTTHSRNLRKQEKSGQNVPSVSPAAEKKWAILGQNPTDPLLPKRRVGSCFFCLKFLSERFPKRGISSTLF